MFEPATGFELLPIYSTRADGSVGCFWQFGGANIPGTTNTFGGNSPAEFGPLLFLAYPGPGFTPSIAGMTSGGGVVLSEV
jgi:hypothetical protein